ncbi:hypothetical protein [Brevibacillus daliensis]|uniref:hypothetical protein n=1 Tax=Brevibacillus daliensis TaxID=2892995 RepID=UPI001E61EDFC|nr:hypothetical protein [Brevibacillus daliensis]
MRDLIEQFATHYVSDLEKQLDNENGQRSIQNPVLFLFLGDKSLQALQNIYAINERKWQNSEGVLYVHAYSEETIERPNLYGFRLPERDTHKQMMRTSLYEKFYHDESYLVELNRIMKLISIRIAELSRRFTSYRQINIAVVTRADDTATILLPELTLLMKSYLAEMFKNVSMDLYVLLQERNDGHDFGFSASLGVSFLEECNKYQRGDYHFRADLQMTEDRVKLAVEHQPAPLFSLVYLLSDKNEHGMFIDNGREENDEVISNLVLLNNKEVEEEIHEGNEGYNKAQFIRSINGVVDHAAFSSAGYSKVTRPTHAIALTVLAHVYDHFLKRVKEGNSQDCTEAMEMLGLTPAHIQRKVISFLPDEEKLDEMSSLMTSGVSFSELTSMTMKEAEQALFDRSSQTFFESNFVRVAREQVEKAGIEGNFRQHFKQSMIENEKIGLYVAYEMTSSLESKSSILQVLRGAIREVLRQLEHRGQELEEIYRLRVDQLEMKKGGFFTRDKERVRSFVRQLFPMVYGKKYEILGLELELELLRTYEKQIEEMHQEVKLQVEQLEGIQKQLKKIAQKSTQEAVDYLGKNIDEYYEVVVHASIHAVEAKRGPRFYFEERYMGRVSALLQNGITDLIQRLCTLCRNEILTNECFAISFEDELLARANVTASYENRDVLTKEELFRDLSIALEDRSSVHIDIFHFTQKHRYEEKYFFADSTSDFVQYVLATEQTLRTYKLGYIHEDQKSGVEKLKLMGGFGMEDLMYYRNNKKYHDSYIENGFVFRRQGEG